MHIDWVIPCRYAEVHDNLGTIVGAGIDRYWWPELPAQMQVVLALRFSGLPEEIPGEHDLVNIVRGPGGEEIARAEGRLAFGELQGDARPDYLQGIQLQSVVIFEATEEGTYSVEFELDKVSTYVVPLHVIHGPPPGVEIPE